jgi:hypothetical protein
VLVCHVVCSPSPLVKSYYTGVCTVAFGWFPFFFSKLACTAVINTHSFCHHVSDLDNNKTNNYFMTLCSRNRLLRLRVNDTAWWSYSYTKCCHVRLSTRHATPMKCIRSAHHKAQL